jgi:hypothetical protein
MTLRRPAAIAALLCFAVSTVAAEGRFDRDGSYVTTNFRTTAPNKELAERFGELAEHYRREKAKEWLGKEMPTWPQRCPLRVELNMKRSGGATEFTFSRTELGVQTQNIRIFGETKQLLYSVLPHEVTHTVLAHHFGQSLPRWADEGGSVLSENEDEWFSHDIRCREILNAGRGVRLRALFPMTEYPDDMIIVYAQGYSICDFLINHHKGGRSEFLRFVGIGMKSNKRNWEQAIKEVYGYGSVDEFEDAWIEHLRKPPLRVAARAKGTPKEAGLTSSSKDTRTSGVSGVPLLESPGRVIRGATPEEPQGRKLEAKPTARPSERPAPLGLLLPPEPIRP